MSVPTDFTYMVPVAVFAASVAGSAHCLGMCGGLAAAAGPTPSANVRYQLGRGLLYVLLGIGAGSVGERLLSDGALRGVAWVTTVLMAFLFILMGLRAFAHQPTHFSLIPKSWLSALLKRFGNFPFVMGGLTALLPCGWLHSFLLGAAATRSPLLGGISMAAFWLGTLPAMTAAPWMIQKVLKPLSLRAPRLSALLLISAGLLTLGFKAGPLISSRFHQHCACEDARGKIGDPPADPFP